MRVLVCGGRGFLDHVTIYRVLNEIHCKQAITEIMQGGARGADHYAKMWAQYWGIKCYVCRANWDRHGRMAGPIRNKRMLEWKPDLVVAFDGGSGTADMVYQAIRAEVPVKCIFLTVQGGWREQMIGGRRSASEAPG